jgi:hypothetical protein
MFSFFWCPSPGTIAVVALKRLSSGTVNSVINKIHCKTSLFGLFFLGTVVTVIDRHGAPKICHTFFAQTIGIRLDDPMTDGRTPAPPGSIEEATSVLKTA